MAGKVTFSAFNGTGRPFQVSIDPDATVGALLGSNLTLAAALTLPNGTVLPAGYVVQPRDVFNVFATGSGTGSPGPSLDWAQLTNIPVNVQNVAAMTTVGIVVRQTAGTWVTRTLGAPAAGLVISNASGDTGAPSFSLANDLAALEGLSSTGIAVRTGADTWAQRVLAVASTARLTVTDPGGVAGNPTFDLATLTDSGTGALLAITRDAWGRVSGSRAAVIGDLAIGGGTAAQFLRGDGTWSNTLIGGYSLQASGGTVSTINSADANGRLRLTGNGASGQAGLIDLDPNPLDAVSAATVRLMRSTNTTGATGVQVFAGNNTATVNHFLAGQAGDTSLALTSGNIAVFGTGSFGSGAKVMFIANRTTAPTVNPVGGGILYAEGGALRWRGSAGSVTTIGPA